MEISHKMKFNQLSQNQVKMKIINLIKIIEIFKLVNMRLKSQILDQAKI